MKTMKLLTTVVLTLVLCANANAKIWRVNGSPAAGADCTTIQAAVDSASAGDVIQVEAGVYQGFNLNKRLSIQGTCYTSAHNDAIKTEISPVIIASNIKVVSGASGSSLYSLNLDVSNSSIDIQVSDIFIGRCKMDDIAFEYNTDAGLSVGTTTIGNITVNGCIITDEALHKSQTSSKELFVGGVIFSNCIIDDLNLDLSFTTFSGSFTNCIFNQGTLGVEESSFTDCIITYTSGTGFFSKLDNNIVRNCISYSPSGNTTSYHQGTDCIFNATGVFDESNTYYTLSDTSIAKTAGRWGGECGIYGGSSPFIPGGYLPQPTITKLVVPATVGGSLNIELEATIIE